MARGGRDAVVRSRMLSPAARLVLLAVLSFDDLEDDVADGVARRAGALTSGALIARAAGLPAQAAHAALRELEARELVVVERLPVAIRDGRHALDRIVHIAWDVLERLLPAAGDAAGRGRTGKAVA